LGFIVSGFNEESHSYPDQIKFLTEINSSVDSDALVTAASIRCFNSLKFFLDTGHDPNKTNAVGRTALYEASRLGDNDAVDLLLNKKANPNIKSKDVLDTALKASLVNEQPEIAIKLLDAGADPNEIGPYGFTALMVAVHFGDLKLIEKLFEKNVNLDTKNEGSQTALMIAAEEGKADILKKLLEKNPDTKITDLQGHDVLYIADDSGHPDCAALLKEYQKKMLGAAGTK
jgi:ankyrin repeat protein